MCDERTTGRRRSSLRAALSETEGGARRGRHKGLAARISFVLLAGGASRPVENLAVSLVSCISFIQGGNLVQQIIRLG